MPMYLPFSCSNCSVAIHYEFENLTTVFLTILYYLKEAFSNKAKKILSLAYRYKTKIKSKRININLLISKLLSHIVNYI